MMRYLLFLLVLCFGCVVPIQAQVVKRSLTVLIVVGAGGEDAYASRFKEDAGIWKTACDKAGVTSVTIGLEPELKGRADADALREWLESFVYKETQALWMVMIGHGSFDGREAKFNLRGRDVSAAELSTWLKPMKRELAVIQTAPASAPFMNALAGQNRVVITATKGADEVFFARFGGFFAKAISGNLEADQDGDQQVSLLEAYLWASRQVTHFYEAEGRLATEHSLLDDNGDGSGTRSEAYEGIRLIQPPGDVKVVPEGLLARHWHLLLNDTESRLSEEVRQRRDAMERDVQALRARKDTMAAEEYYQKLEIILLELAKLYRENAGT